MGLTSHRLWVDPIEYLVPALTDTDNVSIVPTSTHRLPPPPGTPSSSATCTGCIIEAIQPVTYAFEEADSSSWTSVVMTATLLTKTISYFTGTPSALQTVVTEVETVSHTTAITGAYNETITHTTPVLTVEPTPGVTLELPAGTYLFYDKIYGGLYRAPSAKSHESSTQSAPQYHTYSVAHPGFPGHGPRQIFERRATEPTCVAAVETLEINPLRTEDWSYFYQPVTATTPPMSGLSAQPLPPALLKYLNNVPEIKRVFAGANISSCGQLTTGIETPTAAPYEPPATSSMGIVTSEVLTISAGLPSHGGPPLPSSPTRTTSKSSYISTTYQTTSTHISVRGCLRCDTAYTLPPSHNEQPQGIALPPSHNEHPGGKGGQSNEGHSYGGQSHGTDPPESPTGTPIKNLPILSVGSNTFVANSDRQYIFGSQTLSAGGPPITINDYTLSLGPDSNWAVVNGVTQTLQNSLIITEAPGLTIGSQTIPGIVRDGTTEYYLGEGTTLRPGDVVTSSGVTYSLDKLGTALVINGRTSTIPKMPASNNANPTTSAASTGPQDAGRFVETKSSTSSRGGAVLVSRGGLDLWIESAFMAFASWSLMFL